MNKKLYLNEYKSLLLTQIKKYKSKLDSRGLKPIYNYNDYIDIYLFKLETGLSWDRLENIYHISKSQLHSTFTKWTYCNVFKNAFDAFLKKYKIYIDSNNAYIDTTTIFNKSGYVETVGFNTFESKKHRCNKLSCIVNENGIPLGIKLSTGNIHDITLLMDTLPKHKFFNMLYADKSYISKKLKQSLVSKGINMICPNKKNSKNKNTPEEQYELKYRMKVEHVNNSLKQNRTLNTRYIKDVNNFTGFIYLACLKIGLQNLIFNFFKD